MDLATFPTKDSIEGRNNLNVEAAQSTEVSQEDGSFAVDVEPEQDSDQVFLVSDPELGVGSWQSLGFNGTLENQRNAWSNAGGDAVPIEEYDYGINLEGFGDPPLTWHDFSDGSINGLALWARRSAGSGRFSLSEKQTLDEYSLYGISFRYTLSIQMSFSLLLPNLNTSVD